MKIRSPFVRKLAAWIAVGLGRLLFGTVRIVRVETLPETDPFLTESTWLLYSVWHDAVIVMVFCGPHRHMAGLVSRHQDGSYLADAMKMVGISPVRGSTKRGGAQAIRQLMEQSKGKHVTITPDGPRGPRRKMKGGIAFLASRTGRAIVPVGVACTRSWKIRGSWTDMLIPKPFSTLWVVAGEPISVPPNLSRDELDRFTVLLQDAMDQIDARTDRLARGIEPQERETKAAA